MKSHLLFALLSLPLIVTSCSELTNSTWGDDQAIDAPPPSSVSTDREKKSPPPGAAETSPSAPPTAPAAASLLASPEPVTPATQAAPSPLTNGPENPLGFLDPETTGELMTEEKKKTVTSANAQAAPTPEVEGDSAIEIAEPTLPAIKE